MTIDRKLNLMKEYGLTSNELDCVLVIFMAQTHRAGKEYREEDEVPESHPEYLQDWARLHGKDVLRGCLKSLQEKGVILKSYKIPAPGTSFKPNDVEFAQAFYRKYLRNSHDLGRELWDTYPSFAKINGGIANLKNVTKGVVGYMSLDDLFFAYGKAINFSPEKHAEVLEIVRKAEEAGLINMSLLNFVHSQQWEVFKEGFESGLLSEGCSVTFE